MWSFISWHNCHHTHTEHDPNHLSNIKVFIAIRHTYLACMHVIIKLCFYVKYFPCIRFNQRQSSMHTHLVFQFYLYFYGVEVNDSFILSLQEVLKQCINYLTKEAASDLLTSCLLYFRKHDTNMYMYLLSSTSGLKKN